MGYVVSRLLSPDRFGLSQAVLDGMFSLAGFL